MQLIQSAIDGGHRMLLFSQFTSMLALLQAALEKEGIPWVCTRDCGAVLVGIKKRNVQVRTYKK